MSIIVKICGLTTEEGLDAALACGADMVGFVFFDKSPRHVSLELAARLGRRAGKRACKVLLTADAGDAALAAAIAALDPGLLQLHGNETPERAASIRARFGLPVMKAITIGEAADLAIIPRFDAVADYLLFDAKPRNATGRPGGNGERFDWSLLGRIKTKKPWLLAGGLDAESVAEALAQTRAAGVDVSSGVESAPGIKDRNKIAAFVAAARIADESLGPAARSG
jgi:phosphoribosylanthranilate isomerase